MGHIPCHLIGEVGPSWIELSILCCRSTDLKGSPNMLLSGSRDKTLLIWHLTRDEQNYGYPKRSLHGHSHIVSDCVCLDIAPQTLDYG